MSGYTIGQNQTAAACDPSNELETFAERLRGIDKDAALIRDRLERMIGRAFGEGMADSDKKGAPIAAGSVGAIHALLNAIAEHQVAASEAISRLDRLA